MRLMLVVFVWVCLAIPGAVVSAQPAAAPLLQQTETPDPEVTEVPIPQPYRYDTIQDQDVRWDYVISAGDVMIAGLLLILVLSLWITTVITYIGERRE